MLDIIVAAAVGGITAFFTGLATVGIAMRRNAKQQTKLTFTTEEAQQIYEELHQHFNACNTHEDSHRAEGPYL